MGDLPFLLSTSNLLREFGHAWNLEAKPRVSGDLVLTYPQRHTLHHLFFTAPQMILCHVVRRFQHSADASQWHNENLEHSAELYEASLGARSRELPKFRRVSPSEANYWAVGTECNVYSSQNADGSPLEFQSVLLEAIGRMQRDQGNVAPLPASLILTTCNIIFVDGRDVHKVFLQLTGVADFSRVFKMAQRACLMITGGKTSHFPVQAVMYDSANLQGMRGRLALLPGASDAPLMGQLLDQLERCASDRTLYASARLPVGTAEAFTRLLPGVPRNVALADAFRMAILVRSAPLFDPLLVVALLEHSDSVPFNMLLLRALANMFRWEGPRARVTQQAPAVLACLDSRVSLEAPEKIQLASASLLLNLSRVCDDQVALTTLLGCCGRLARSTHPDVAYRAVCTVGNVLVCKSMARHLVVALGLGAALGSLGQSPEVAEAAAQVLHLIK